MTITSVGTNFFGSTRTSSSNATQTFSLSGVMVNGAACQAGDVLMVPLLWYNGSAAPSVTGASFTQVAPWAGQLGVGGYYYGVWLATLVAADITNNLVTITQGVAGQAVEWNACAYRSSTATLFVDQFAALDYAAPSVSAPPVSANGSNDWYVVIPWNHAISGNVSVSGMAMDPRVSESWVGLYDSNGVVQKGVMSATISNSGPSPILCAWAWTLSEALPPSAPTLLIPSANAYLDVS